MLPFLSLMDLHCGLSVCLGWPYMAELSLNHLRPFAMTRQWSVKGINQTNQSTNQSTNQLINWSTNQIDQLINQPIKPINQIDQLIKQTNQLINQPTNQSINWSTNQSIVEGFLVEGFSHWSCQRYARLLGCHIQSGLLGAPTMCPLLCLHNNLAM